VGGGGREGRRVSPGEGREGGKKGVEEERCRVRRNRARRRVANQRKSRRPRGVK